MIIRFIHFHDSLNIVLILDSDCKLFCANFVISFNDKLYQEKDFKVI